MRLPAALLLLRLLSAASRLYLERLLLLLGLAWLVPILLRAALLLGRRFTDKLAVQRLPRSGRGVALLPLNRTSEVVARLTGPARGPWQVASRRRQLRAGELLMGLALPRRCWRRLQWQPGLRRRRYRWALLLYVAPLLGRELERRQAVQLQLLHFGRFRPSGRWTPKNFASRNSWAQGAQLRSIGLSGTAPMSPSKS